MLDRLAAEEEELQNKIKLENSEILAKQAGTHCHSPTHSLTYLLTHLPTHSPSHLLTHSSRKYQEKCRENK